jgi:hypothetical protein
MATTVHGHFKRDAPEVAQVVVALRERLRVAHDALDVLLLDAGKGQQRMLHSELVLPDDVQLVPGG